MQVTVGAVSGAFGVRGWVRVRSFTRPPEALFDYAPWLLCRGDTSEPVAPAAYRPAADGFAVRLPGVAHREAAMALRGAEIRVDRNALPPAEPGEFYWVDLIGLRVENRRGECLGTVKRLVETGAHDVLVLAGAGPERLVPFVSGVYVDEVDLDAGLIRVDWHADD